MKIPQSEFLSLFLFSFIIFLFVSSTQSLTINGYEIRDLESSTSFLETEASLWQVSNRITSKNASQCSGTWLLGGYGVTTAGATFTRTYYSLPSHNMVYFSLKTWVLDLEEARNLFSLSLDGQSINTWSTSSFNYGSLPIPSICGGSKKDYSFLYIEGTAPHTALQITVQIKMLNVAGDTFSVGFRELDLLFQATGSVSSTVCQYALSGSSPSCICPAGTFNSAGSGSCSSCSTSCGTCIGSASKCTSCDSGYSFNGQNCYQCDPTCDQCNGTASTDCVRCTSNKFLYWNGTCQSSCDPPFVSRSEGEMQFCDSPCTSSEYLYQNNTCQTDCVSPFTPETEGSTKFCNFPCPASNYLYWNGTCSPTCAYPLVNVTAGVERYCMLPCNSSEFLLSNDTCTPNCTYPFTARADGDLNYCDFRCSSSQYLYWNGTCDTCEAPLINSTTGVERYCSLPCPSSEYLFENKTCSGTCNTSFIPTIQGDLKTCNFPCSGLDYLYWNGSCLPSCPISFQQIYSGIERYCEFYCTTGFLYENNTCESTCESPFLQNVDAESYQFCNLPCDSGEFLYPNGSCLQQCDYTPRTSTDGITFCDYPCPSNTFLYGNNSCLSTCETPFSPQEVDTNLTLCTPICSGDEFYSTDISGCVSECDSPSVVTQSGMINYCSDQQIPPDRAAIIGAAMDTVASGVALAGSILRPSSSNSPFMISIAKLIKYIKYLNVPIPPEIIAALDSGKSSKYSISTTFSYPLPASLEREVPSYDLPTPFNNQQGLSSSFLINHWESITAYLILIVLGIVCRMLELIMQRYRNRYCILTMRRLRITFQWGFLLFVIFNTYDDITFFTLLELQTAHFDNPYSILSFTVCLLISCLSVALLIFVFILNKKVIRLKNQVADVNSPNPEVLFYKKFQSVQVLYCGFKNTSLLTQSYLVLSTVRLIAIYFIVVFLYSHPLIQTVQFALFSCLMLLYIIKRRPMKDLFEYIVALTFEILAFVANICVATLAILDATDRLTDDTKYGLGHAILIINTMVDIFSNIYMWGYILMAMRGAYIAGKKYGFSGKTNWLVSPIASYSNPGMDFDELSNYENLETHTVQKIIPQAKTLRAVKIKPTFAKLETLVSIKSSNLDSDTDTLSTENLKLRSRFTSMKERKTETDQSEVINNNDTKESPTHHTQETETDLRRISSIALLTQPSPTNSGLNTPNRGSIYTNQEPGVKSVFFSFKKTPSAVTIRPLFPSTPSSTILDIPLSTRRIVPLENSPKKIENTNLSVISQEVVSSTTDLNRNSQRPESFLKRVEQYFQSKVNGSLKDTFMPNKDDAKSIKHSKTVEPTLKKTISTETPIEDRSPEEKRPMVTRTTILRRQFIRDQELTFKRQSMISSLILESPDEKGESIEIVKEEV